MKPAPPEHPAGRPPQESREEPTLTVSSGPAFSPTSETGMGLVSPEPLCLHLPPGPRPAERAVGLELPGAELVGRRICLEDELHFAVFPEALEVPPDQDMEQRWAATAVAVDLVFEDGTRLSELGGTDQYGAALTPAAQAEARRSWPDQWNLRTVPLNRAAGRTIHEVRVTALPDAQRGLRCHVDGIAVEPAPSQPTSLLEAADTRRGTHSSGEFSRGNNAPLVCVPHGGLFGLPMTDASSSRWPYSYHRGSQADLVTGRVRQRLEGFATSHLPSPWMGDRGVLILAPSVRTAPADGRSPQPRRERGLWFDHAAETAHPHHYGVQLWGEDDDGARIRLEASMTASHHALGLHFSFEAPGSLILDHRGRIRNAAWELRDGVLSLEGSLYDREDTPQQHIALRLSGVTGVHLRRDEEGLAGYVTVDAGEVEAVVALSEVSPELARQHLAEHWPSLPPEQLVPPRSRGMVDTMRQEAERRWQEVLGRVHVDQTDLQEHAPAQRDRLTALASNLYRVFAYPNRAGERSDSSTLRHRNPAGGALRRRIAPEDAPEVAEGELTVTNGFWDTYRTEWPLLGLLDPQRAGELAAGLLSHARDSDWMPRWSAPGPCDVMTGTSSDIVFADLATRQVPGVSWEEAYRTAVRHACTPPEDLRVGRKGLRPGIFRGHINTDTPEGMSWTLDNAINDAGAARLARGLVDSGVRLHGHDLEAEAEYFERRALSYQNVFHTGLGFFLGRTPDGGWRQPESFDPDVWGSDYTETNAWGARITAPHDPSGLVRIYGGEEALGAALDELVARPERAEQRTAGSYGTVIHEQHEARDCRQGMLALSNQPAHHIPFMYMAAGRHDCAHRLIGDAFSRLFAGSDLGQGYPGDEDNGEMSAWWLFTTLGLYPLVPASGEYVLCPPRWREIAVDLPHTADDGAPARLRVTSEGPVPLGGTTYIREVRIDGEPWTSITVPHARIKDGAHLHVELSEEPCGWAADSRPTGLTERILAGGGRAEPLVDALIGTEDPAHAALIDDTGEREVTLGAGESAVLLFGGDSPGTEAGLLYTVTSAAIAGTAAWQLTGVDDDGAETILDERHGETFGWARQTRVFRAGSPGRGEYRLRFTALSELRLEQLEVFAR